MIFRLLPFGAIFLVAGCASDAPPSVWVRTDGQRIGGNSALEQKVDIDKTICNGEMQKAGLSGQQQFGGSLLSQAIVENQRGERLDGVAKGCMAEKGYVSVPITEAQARSDAYAAANGGKVATR